MERDYLLEIGCEELPAGFIGPALYNGGRLLEESLRKARLGFRNIDLRGTPRRLAFIVRGLAMSQETRSEAVLGPPKSVAFDAQGKPTKAALGFAKSQGVDLEALSVFPTERGDYVGLMREEAALETHKVLPKIAAEFIPSIPFKKSMRWADLDVRFARPAHWIVSLYGEDVIPFRFGNIDAGRTTYGHRFLSPGPIDLVSPDVYEKSLAEAYVLVDLEARKERIRGGLLTASKRIGAKLVEDEPLVETTANLVEFPVVLQGGFEKKYLVLPREILVTTMRNNQKYFAFEDDQGLLSPYFAFVCNMLVPDEQVVISGNERVLRSRLSDAEFYYWDDLKTPLFDRAQALKKVLFQADLGTYWEKTERMAQVAAFVASFGFPQKMKDCERAAFLCKADLTTGVVKEFPELQGVMGRHYALKTGEEQEISESIHEHYLPKGQSDDLPGTDIGAAAAIADKIDMVCGCFGVGLIPTGAADPYGLRRHTLGILSILEAKGLRILIDELVDRSLSTLSSKLKFPADEVKLRVMEFIAARFLNLQVSRGISADLVEAVIAAGITDVVDLRAKLSALADFRAQEAFEPLAEVFKRAINITKAYDGPLDVSERFFETQEEKALYAASHGVSDRIREAARDGRYPEAFREMAALQPLVAAFFDKVLVMAQDADIRNNRLAMLKGLSAAFSFVADFSRISSSGQKKPV